MRALVEMENSGLVPMLTGDALEDLGRMYSLFRRAEGGLDLLRSVMGAHLKEQGRQLVQVNTLGLTVPRLGSRVWNHVFCKGTPELSQERIT